MGVRDIVFGVTLAVVAFWLHQQYGEYSRRTLVSRVTRKGPVDKQKFQNYTNVFRTPKVVKVTSNIHVAMGYALANSIMIEGSDGIVIIDVTESVHAGKKVLEAFREISQKQIKAIVYTHNHADHTYGAKAFLEDPAHPPEIWAHADLLTHLQRHFYTNSILLQRATRMFGVLVPDTVSAGIGPRLHIGTNAVDLGIVFPNKLMTGSERDVHVAGLDLKLVHIPGETEDQIGVWLPRERAFLCADDVYEAFPNLYSIRGTPTRDLLHWADSLDRILALRPQYLVPSHTAPVVGEDAIRELLTGYRDAIQLVHDQTLRYMNKGYLPDEIAPLIKLPSHLAAHPYLQEFYGTVFWSAKGVFNAYMGWFSGDPADLSPLTPNEMAERMVKFGGGVDKVAQESQSALEKEDYQWALVLSSYVVRVDKNHETAKEVRSKSLMALGDQQTSTNGRNYYYTSALEEMGEVDVKPGPQRTSAYIRQVPIVNLFKVLQTRWNVEECGVINCTIVFKFTDTKQIITMTTRNSIIVIDDRSPASKADVVVTTSEVTWREALTSGLTAMSSLAKGDLKVDGSAITLKKVLGCLDGN